MQPLDPLEFLVVAREIASMGGDAQLRTAVGRAYYCCFLIARDKMGVTTTRDVHKRVITAVRGVDGYWAVADELDSLRRLRVTADYQLLPTISSRRNWPRNWVRTEQIVADILPRLQAL